MSVMTGFDDTPIFNLKAVVRETGLKPDTLRAWERRYGLPEPKRTAGGHRLYSQRDIQVLKWLIARQIEGMSISRAVDLWRTREQEGRDPLDMAEYAGANGRIGMPMAVGGDAITELRTAWLDACQGFDEQTAEHILAEAFALAPPETVCFEILQKGLSEIGDRWYTGDATVQQEHFASALAMRRIEALLAATPAPTRPGRILIGCPPEEEHSFSPLMLTLLLRRQGRDVIYLGARVPLERLEQTIATARPGLVIMAAQQLYTAGTLYQMAVMLRQMRVAFAYGGAIFNVLPDLIDQIPGHFLGALLEEAPQAVEQLLKSAPALPTLRPLADDYRALLADIRAHETQIEARVWGELHDAGIAPTHLATANLMLGRNIDTCLQLGNLQHLTYDLEWIRGLLASYGVPVQLFDRFMRSYRDAVEAVLGERGALLSEWLDEVVRQTA